MKKLILALILAGTAPLLVAQEFLTMPYRKPLKPTRNVILMITDGTSIDVPSAARWYKLYNGTDNGRLAIDDLICGTIRTYCSNAPIADSAPAMGAFTTGMPQTAGNIAIYPPKTDQDLVMVDETRSYQPMATILEGAKQLHKATGLVVSVEFPHATPAATASHGAKRNDYDRLAPQIAFQNLEVCFGGGVSLVTDRMKDHFNATGTSYYANDMEAFRAHKQGKVWSLWCDRHTDYVLDADTTKQPSLAEMTDKALSLLNQHEEGFFLMVEGSKIDWAAHGNDAMACITEYLDFDAAVQKAIDFAKKDGNTTVVITADHGNSGFSLGRYDLKGYYKAGLEKLFGQISKVKRSIYGFEALLKNKKPEDFNAVFEEYAGFSLSKEDIERLTACKDYQPDDYMKAADAETMVGAIAKILNKHNWIGFTTGGHTGEDTFLACYNPNNELPVGMNENYELNQYLQGVVGVNLAAVTDSMFASANSVFSGLKMSVSEADTNAPLLHVKSGKKTLSIRAYESVATLNNGNKKEELPLAGICVYMPEKKEFYLPKSARDLLK